MELLDERAGELSESRNALAERLLAEALRTERHPLIAFRTGGSGLRRPGIIGSRIYVWQILSMLRAGDSVTEVADALTLPQSYVQAAVDYYADFKDEVDAYEADELQYAERERERWERAQQVLD